MEIGERWAYRPQTTGKFHEVKILAFGLKRPPRIRIQFIEDEWEDEKRWVPPARLEVPWAGVDGLIEYNAAIKRLTSYYEASEAEQAAMERVFFTLIDLERVADDVRRRPDGATRIYDLDALADQTGIPASDFTNHPDVLRDRDGSLLVPWPLTLRIAKAVAERQPEPLMKWIRKQEELIKIESVTGHEAPAWITGESFHVTGERLLEYYESTTRPQIECLMVWIGAGEPWKGRDLEEARAELSRVGDIALRAVFELKRLRSNRNADALLQELLDPLSVEVRQTGYITTRERDQMLKRATRYRWTLVDEPELKDAAPQKPHNSPQSKAN
jgi:hypothetical protein